MLKRIDQQDRVNRIIFGAFDLEKISNKKLRSYLYSYLQIMCNVTTYHNELINTEATKQKKVEASTSEVWIWVTILHLQHILCVLTCRFKLECHEKIQYI